MNNYEEEYLVIEDTDEENRFSIKPKTGEHFL
jgi:hypothetical protein